MKSEAPAPRRSDATRAAILAAAREQFASGGYQAATIRSIAAAAGIDPAMVMRYFGNKEGLFAAAAEFDLQLPDLGGVPRKAVGAALVDHFLDRWEGDESLMALLRTAVTNEAAAERMRAIFATQLAPVIARLSGEPTRGRGPGRADRLADPRPRPVPLRAEAAAGRGAEAAGDPRPRGPHGPEVSLRPLRRRPVPADHGLAGSPRFCISRFAQPKIATACSRSMISSSLMP